MHAMHDDLLGGHLGVENLLNKVTRRFWWPGLAGDVAEWVRTCPICQARKRNYNAPVGKMQPIVTERRFQHVVVDIMCITENDERERGNSAPFIEHFTKWPESYAVPDISADTVAGLFVRRYICTFSVPQQISSRTSVLIRLNQGYQQSTGY